MKKVLLGIFSVFLLSSTNCYAEPSNTMADNAEFTDAWARATFPAAKTGAAYMQLTNVSDGEIVLTKASALNDIANMTELHETIMQDDMMQMREMSDGIMINPNQTVSFEPGGKHVMFMGLSNGLIAEETVEVKFTFSDQSTKVVKFPIKDAR